MQVKLLSQKEIDALSDAELELYHHQLQNLGTAVYEAKRSVKTERDARAALAKLSPAAQAAIKAKTIRAMSEASASVPGEV